MTMPDAPTVTERQARRRERAAFLRGLRTPTLAENSPRSEDIAYLVRLAGGAADPKPAISEELAWELYPAPQSGA